MNRIQKFAIPLLVLLAATGIASFILAYNFYPEKHVNIRINNNCYEFLGDAFKSYQKLNMQKSIQSLRYQLDAIKEKSVIIPITFSGTLEEISEFTNKHQLKISSSSTVGYINNAITSNIQIVKAEITSGDLQKLIDNLKPEDMDPLKKTLKGSLGIMSNPYITPEESKEISKQLQDFMRSGIINIVNSEKDIKLAECRGTIRY